MDNSLTDMQKIDFQTDIHHRAEMAIKRDILQHLERDFLIGFNQDQIVVHLLRVEQAIHHQLNWMRIVDQVPEAEMLFPQECKKEKVIQKKFHSILHIPNSRHGKH